MGHLVLVDTPSRVEPTDHDGALRNGASWEEGRWPSKKGVSFRGGGHTDTIDIGKPNIYGVGARHGFTVMAWFKPRTFTPGDARIVSRTTSTNSSDHLFMLSTRDVGSDVGLRFRLRAGGATDELLASAGNLELDSWTHAAATYDGMTMKIFKDGQLVDQMAKTGDLPFNTWMRAAIGNTPQGAGNRCLDGVIDEVAVFNRALRTQEIREHFEVGHP